MLGVLILLVDQITCYHLLFTEFTSRSCDMPPTAIRVIEDFDTLDVSLPWIDMLDSITGKYYAGECGYATTINCCYSSTNPPATGDIGSAFLVEMDDIEDYSVYLPQTANGNAYVKINAMNGTALGNLYEMYARCDGSCIDGTIRCYGNQTVNLYSDSQCETLTESIVLDTSVYEYIGELGSFNLQFLIMENGSFKRQYKAWINYDYWGVDASPIGHGLFLTWMGLSTLLTLVLLYRNFKSFVSKPSFYTVGNFILMVFWLIYSVIFIVTIFFVSYEANSVAQICFMLSLYISGIIAAKMWLKFVILPYFDGTKATGIKWSVYFVLTFIHGLTCWPSYLYCVYAFYLGDEAFDSAYQHWYRYFDIWIYIIFICNGLISTIWVAILQSSRLAKTEDGGKPGRYSMGHSFKLLMLNDSGFLYIFLGQLILLLSYGAVSFVLIHIDLTMDFIADDAIYDSFYALETLILTCHYALVDACIVRMKTVFGTPAKPKTQKPGKNLHDQGQPLKLMAIGSQGDKSTIQIADKQPVGTTRNQTTTIDGKTSVPTTQFIDGRSI